MFSRVLIANRGEIACRVIRTCRNLGIETVAVYSEADVNSRHVREADHAVMIGPAEAKRSYLAVDAIMKAAASTLADAIHPGYGFLSEKLELIDACVLAGIAFIGPNRDAIARIGSKIESKRIARAAGVRCVPGYDGEDQSEQSLRHEAWKIGVPLLIKASAGGGGKGMKRVDNLEEFGARLDEARREAMAAFGDQKVLLERYILRPRHLEVQLLGDRHGNLVHLFERECSIQRNYQKVIEEAPANHLPARIRDDMFTAALALGRAISYDSTGTVEFMLDADADAPPYFLEMNTRLQVEHPVTEMTTGLDLVEWQIRIAAGESLPFQQAAIRRNGWAIEARINAEDPGAGFKPSIGRILDYAEPVQANGLRIDSGVDAQSEITPHYDSMLAKIIAFGATRKVAKERIARGLKQLRISGLRTNQGLLKDIVGSAQFDETLTTRLLIDRFPDGWQVDPALSIEASSVAAAAWFFMNLPTDPESGPLATLVGFRLTAPSGLVARYPVNVRDPSERIHRDLPIRIEYLEPGTLRCFAGKDAVRIQRNATGLIVVTERSHRAYSVIDLGDDLFDLWSEGECCQRIVLAEGAAPRAVTDRGETTDQVRAELPGVVAEVPVRPGDRVVKGATIVVMEAMKLIHTLTAPRDVVIKKVHVDVGQTVAQGVVLVDYEPALEIPLPAAAS